MLSAQGGVSPKASMEGRDYSVVFRVPNKNYFVHDPGMILLPGGKLLAAVPCWGRSAPNAPSKNTGKFLKLKILSSTDKGATWNITCELPYAEATPFLCEGRLYMFVQYKQHDGVWFVTSEDEGKTWSSPVEVLKGRYWNCQTAMVINDRNLYWPVSEGFEKMGVISCDLRKGILNPKAWRASQMVEMPIPNEIVAGSFTRGKNMVCLEGNMVNVKGRLRVIARASINSARTANIAAIFDLKDSDGKLDLSFTQLSSLPGGQCKFSILYDEPSRLFWMASNLVENSQDLVNASEQLGEIYPKGGWKSITADRRFLTLWYSIDALNWFPAGWIAAAEKVTQSFMYPSMVVDGDDLVLLSRTARESGDYHDADLATFHRITDFRSKAMDITPRN
jgi:hypothetical protein